MRKKAANSISSICLKASWTHWVRHIISRTFREKENIQAREDYFTIWIVLINFPSLIVSSNQNYLWLCKRALQKNSSLKVVVVFILKSIIRSLHFTFSPQFFKLPSKPVQRVLFTYLRQEVFPAQSRVNYCETNSRHYNNGQKLCDFL